MLEGVLRVGLDADQLTGSPPRTEWPSSPHAISAAAALGADGATTVAATSAVAAAAGIRVFATGGLGGVHAVRPRPSTSRPTW
jgi:pseudouridine-5'-phosphate glycosidase